MKRLMIIILIISASTAMFAQTSADALRYSRILYQGTARYQGLGGAFGAIGADFSAVQTNPAGLGLFNSSEFTISPSAMMEKSMTDFYGESNRDNKFNIGLGDLGLVIHMAPANKSGSGFKAFNIGIGVNRENNFNGRTYLEGVNNTSSLLTSYANILNNQPGITSQMIADQYPFDIALAYNTNLVYYDTIHHRFTNDATNGGVIQRKSIYTSGSINEYDFSFAGNFNNRLYFGATVGVPVIRYYETTRYEEIKQDPTVPFFRSMTYNQTLQTNGTGINLKIGVIYRPADWVRIGAAIHTPTYFGNMRDSWNSDMTSVFDSLPKAIYSQSYSQNSPDGFYQYELTTPFRAIGSVAFIIGKYGLISAEYEYADYSQARLGATGDTSTFSGVNKEIQNKYRAPLNLRFGTEWCIGNFRVRGGIGYYGSPYKSGINTGEEYTGSIGWGYRGKHAFVDMAYQFTQMKSDYYLYDPTLVDPSHNTLNSSTITATLGLRF